MKKITVFLASFVLCASVFGQSHLMSVDGQETHKNLNPNPYEIQAPTEYTGLVFDKKPIAGITMYYALCDKTCYANNVQVSAQVGLVRLLQQLSIINRAEQGQLYTFNGQIKDFDISDAASVSVAKELIEKYGSVKHVDFKGGTFSLLGVKNDFGGGNGWITYNNVGDWNCLVLDLSLALNSPTSVYPIAKADCTNNGDDPMLTSIKNGLASLIGGSGQNQNSVPGGSNQSASNSGGPNPANDQNLQALLALLKQNGGGQGITLNYNVAQGGQGGTATNTNTPAASSYGCPNPNVQNQQTSNAPVPQVHYVGGPQDHTQAPFVAQQQPAYTEQPAYNQPQPRYVQQQSMIQTNQGQVMVPQGSYVQGNTLYNPNGQIIAELDGIRKASIATAVGTWVNVGVTALFGGLALSKMGNNNSTPHYVGGPGTLSGNPISGDGVAGTYVAQTQTLSGNPQSGYGVH